MFGLDKLAVTQLSGVGKATAQRLAQLQIYSVYDVLLHCPSGYQDRSRTIPIATTTVGQMAVIEGTITHTKVQLGRRRSLLCTLADDSGSIVLRFFHFNATQQRASLHEGARLRCFSQVRMHRQQKHMVHPEYQVLNTMESAAHGDGAYTPIYPSTAGMSQAVWRKLSMQALKLLHQHWSSMHDTAVEAFFKRYGLPDLLQALQVIHNPSLDEDLTVLQAGQHVAQQRLVFAELLAHHLQLRQLRARLAQDKAVALLQQSSHKLLLQQLPFALTAAQQRAINIISQELAQTQPMLRLLQGDVGSGKTLVALFALLQAAANQYQAVLMAPTELLAQQHLHTIQQWTQKLHIKCLCLSGQLTAAVRRDYLAQIASGEVAIIVGTHAVFQQAVEVPHLALIVIDEQHRFGVKQRLALRDKAKTLGYVPHQLVMTATPIPRTLAMTCYADLACTVLDELPPGRTPVTTVAVAHTRRDEVIARIRACCRTKQQAYWVCTLITESDVLQCQAAESALEQLQAQLPELNIALIHGRSPSVEKQAIMQAFRQGGIDLLVATTVIEVGVDVPNASLMIIENPERLGLAQLHQLRGRVGRGWRQSYCVLLYQAPLSSLAHERLAILRASQDGFVIAEKDLALRGPGDILGTRQAGMIQFRIADLVHHQGLLPKVQAAADDALSHHPDLVPKLIADWNIKDCLSS